MAGINFVRRWVMSQMTKKADDGIMITLPDSSKVDLNVNITMDRLLRNGIDPDAFTNPQQVDNAINMINSRMVERAIPANSAEGREITEKLFGKQKAPVFDLEGNRIPEGSGIMGGKSVKSLMDSGQVTKGARGMKKSKKVEDREMFQAANKRLTSDVDSIINNIKSMEPIPAMKEANSVIARKGKYKNLTPEQSKKILQDTEDHIFERYPVEDPEDFAKGGRAGYKSGNSVLDQALAVASVPYNFAKGMVGNVSNPGAVTDVSLTGAQKDFLDDIAASKGPSGTIDYSDYGGPTKTFSGVSGMNPMQASLATTMGGTSYSTNPDGSINYTGGAYDFNKGNVVTDFIDKGGILGAVDRLGDGAIGKVGASIYDTVNPEEDYDFSGIEGQTAGLGVLTGLNKLFGPKIGAAIFRAGKNKAKTYVGKNIVKPQIDKAIKKIKTKKTTTNSGGGGGSSQANVGGGNTAKNSLGQTAAQATAAGTGTSQGYSQHYADGGITRANFVGGGMGRRGFLKMLAGLGGGIAAAKTGLLKFAGKEPAKQVAKELTSVPIGNPEGMPTWFKPLVNKIIKEGDDVTKKLSTKEREIIHTKKIDEVEEVTVYQDLNTGDVRLEYGPHLTDDTGKVIRASNEPTVIQLEYKASEVIEPDLTTGKGGGKTKEEFSAMEAEPEVVNWEGDIEMSGENVVNTVDDLVTDTSKLKKYATDNKLTLKEISDSINKQRYKKKLESDPMEQVNYIEDKQGMNAMDYIDEGARVGDFDPKGYSNYETKGMNLPEKKASGGIAGMLGE